eukprot:1916590-Pleurochrysis_carterae.AAC.1
MGAFKQAHKQTEVDVRQLRRAADPSRPALPLLYERGARRRAVEERDKALLLASEAAAEATTLRKEKAVLL